jgi:hypothetical protein
MLKRMVSSRLFAVCVGLAGVLVGVALANSSSDARVLVAGRAIQGLSAFLGVIYVGATIRHHRRIR